MNNPASFIRMQIYTVKAAGQPWHMMKDWCMICNALQIIRDAYYNRGVAQFGRALRSGRRGRGFESRRLDTKKGIALW